MISPACKALLIATGWLAAIPTAADAQVRRATEAERWLAKTIIPRLEFHDAELNDAIHTLQEECRRADARRHPSRDGYGVSVFVKTGPFTPRSAEESAALPPVATAAPMPRITLSLRRVSVLKALKKVAAYAGLKAVVGKYRVEFVPWNDCADPLVTVTLRTPPKFIGLPDEPGEIAAGEVYGGSAAAHMDARPILESCGMTFPQGAWAVY